jgi:sporulation protein YlmC with PRC-barrel domain
MLRSLKELFGYDIQADDGEIGKVHDFYFDEEEWTTRYLVVDTGPWFLGEKVLIAPSA